MLKKNIIWQNMDLNIKDFEDILQEDYPEVIDENKKQDIINDLNIDYLFDVRENLDIQLSNTIIAIVDGGTWRGRVQGYSIINSGNIKDCLYSECDYVEWYCDAYNMKSTQVHHDGTNYILYRELKDEAYLDLMINKIYFGTLTKNDISKYTRSLRPHIQEVYGF